MKTQPVPLAIAAPFCVIVIGAVLTACSPREEPLPQEVTSALQARYNANDANGAADLFTEDGVIMSEFGESVRGRAAIREFFRGELDKRMQYWVAPEGTTAVGNFGYDFGTMRVRDTAKGEDLENAKYMTLYRKVGDSWKIQRFIYNTNSPAACASVQMIPVGSEGETKAP